MKEKKSVMVASGLIVLFGAVLLVMLPAAPAVCRWYVGLRGVSREIFRTILICWYLCTLPAALALWKLWKLLRRIGAGQPFDPANIRAIADVGWCALACALICAVGMVVYPPFLLVSVAMFFLFAIVRVVAACFRMAAALAEENSLTI